MKVVCICDAGVPEMLMQYMKKLPGCDVTLYTEKTLTDIKSLTTCERTAELRGAEACPVSAEMLEAVREAEILVTHVAPVNRAVLDAAPTVKIVGVLRTGTENVNLDLCRERGIAVYNAEGRNSTAVADLVVIDLHQANMQPEHNTVKNLVYSGSNSNVLLTMVNGKILYENGVYHVGESPEDIVAHARAATERIINS